MTGSKAKASGDLTGVGGLFVELKMKMGGSVNIVYVYLDSSMLVALFDPDDMHHVDAVRVFHTMVKMGYKMITSLLAVMEAVAAVRKKAARSHRCKLESAEERAGVEAHMHSMAGGMAKFVDEMVEEKTLRIMDLKGRSPDLELLYGKVLEHAGSVVPVAKGDRFRYRGVGSCDWLHFWLALVLGAAIICTADKAFADIPGRDKEFGGIAVQLTSEPLSTPLA